MPGMSSTPDFTPAAGRFVPTSAYDWLLAVLTREKLWRAALLKLLAPKPGEHILDVGSGTGSFGILVKQAEPDAAVAGIDPDPQARSIAHSKAVVARVDIIWHEGFAHDAVGLGQFDKVVSSLVFHQVPMDGKIAGLSAMYAATKTGGAMIVADYARQSRWLMRQGFKIVQFADGRTNTQPNADGFLEAELSRLWGRAVTADWSLDTPTGTISIFLHQKT
jgi:ubiquinone/menaquinone biosynthesis C-methylase UbiE